MTKPKTVKATKANNKKTVHEIKVKAIDMKTDDAVNQIDDNVVNDIDDNVVNEASNCFIK